MPIMIKNNSTINAPVNEDSWDNLTITFGPKVTTGSQMVGRDPVNPDNDNHSTNTDTPYEYELYDPEETGLSRQSNI